MSGLSVSGIASGIDSDSIISQMVALETRSLSNLQRRIAIEEAERVTFEDISGRLSALQGATKVFSSESLFASLSAVSSATDLLTVSATDAAPRGTHKIKVIQNALAHRIGGRGIEDPLSTILTDSFEVTDFTNLGSPTLGAYDSGSREITRAEGSDFVAESAVTLKNKWGGDTNNSIVVEFLSDYSNPGGVGGSVDLKISLDGGKTFETFNGLSDADNDGVITLGGDPKHFGAGTNIEVDINVAATNGPKDGDSFMFRVRAKASLEYKVGDTGERKEIIFETEDTLSEIVRKINDDADLGIRADILNDGSPTDPFRLILTSLEEGRAGEINILNNGTDILLEGLSFEDPHNDSLTYTGTVNVSGTLKSGLGNSSVVVEMIDIGAGGFANARYRISNDGGFTFHDNNGAGFAFTDADLDGFLDDIDLDSLLQDDGITKVFQDASGLTLNLQDNGSEFSVGDRITVDLFDSEIQAAQDALINVNGINLVKSSNTVDDVFDGLTLNLKGADPDKTVTVIVSEKAGDITASMSAFVEQYNSVMSVLHAQSKFNPEEDTDAPLLMGDATIRQIQTSLQRYVSGRISILGGDSLSSLGDIGVTTDSKTGQLIFDPTKLNSALSDDPTAVRRILSRFGDLIDGANASFVGSTSATKAGTYTIEVTQARTRAQSVASNPAVAMGAADGKLQFGIVEGDVKTNLQVTLKANSSVASQIATIQEEFDNREIDATVFLDGLGKINVRHNQYGEDFTVEVSAVDANATNSGFLTLAALPKDGFGNVTDPQFDTGTDLIGKMNGIEVTSDDDILVGKDGFAFEDLRVRVSNDFIGEAGQIRLNDGLGSSFANLLEDFIGFEGVLKTRIGSFDSVIARIEQQMDRVTERASKLEDRLRKQFVNLEVTLGKLNATGDYLSQQLKALPGVNSNKK